MAELEGLDEIKKLLEREEIEKRIQIDDNRILFVSSIFSETMLLFIISLVFVALLELQLTNNNKVINRNIVLILVVRYITFKLQMQIY